MFDCTMLKAGLTPKCLVPSEGFLICLRRTKGMIFAARKVLFRVTM